MTSMRPGPSGVQEFIDAMPGDQVPTNVSPMLEVGKTGLKRVSGYVDEEFLPQLRGRKAVQVYREMLDNDPIIGALLFAIDRLLREITWRVEPASQSPEDKQNSEFLEECMEDMSHTWDDFISEVLTMVPYGWAWCEVTMKKRMGPWEKDASKRSKHTDGRIGWRKISLRAQETMTRWVFDQDGGIKALVQMAPPNYTVTVIPIEKSLLFRTSIAKNNPEGRSLLRNAYRPWYMKKRIEEHEAIGIERDLAGLPVGRVPAEYLDAKPGTKQEQMIKSFRKMVRSVRRDEQEGIVLPSQFDENGNQLYEFELMTSGGSRQFDTDSIIQRYEQRMLMSVLADFILVGHESTGSYSMHTDKRGLFQTTINSLTQTIADVINRYAVPKLFAANGIKPESLPTIVPNDVDPPDLTQLAGFMTAMTSAGMQWFPDPELEKFIRDAARLPELDEETEELKEIQYRQKNIMELATQRLTAVQMEQQAAQGEIQTQQSQMGLEQTQMGMDQQRAAMEVDPTGLGAPKEQDLAQADATSRQADLDEEDRHRSRAVEDEDTKRRWSREDEDHARQKAREDIELKRKFEQEDRAAKTGDKDSARGSSREEQLHRLAVQRTQADNNHARRTGDLQRAQERQKLKNLSKPQPQGTGRTPARKNASQKDPKGGSRGRAR